MSYVIGSFNLRDFNFANEIKDGVNEELKRDFDKIAKIIIDERFDIVALQEINAQIPLKHLSNVLNKYKNYSREYACDFGYDMPNQQGSKDPERYGFIYNKKRLRLINLRNKNNPSYYARFTARGMLGGSNFELRLVNTHIKDAVREEDKIKEFKVLVRQVLPRICDHQEVSEDEEIMPAYTFLLGDYNLALNKSDRAIWKIEKVETTNFTGKYRKFINVQEDATTLRIPNGQVQVDDCYANNYDHFTYETDLDCKLILKPQRVEALSKYFSESGVASEMLRDYRKKVSDHVPIKMTIDLK